MPRLFHILSVPERASALAAALAFLVAASVLVAQAGDQPLSSVQVRTSGDTKPVPPSATAQPDAPDEQPVADTDHAAGGVAYTVQQAPVLENPAGDAAILSRVGSGHALPVMARADGFVQVLTPCQVTGWIPTHDVRIQPAGLGQPAGAGRAFHEAVFVIDPGHGGREPGAVGPTGLTEKEANDAIMYRLADILSEPRDVDWSTGRILDGTTYGPPRVILTRYSDFEAALQFRSYIANAARADAFISIHNNAAPDGSSDRPGLETYYQYHSAQSKRLGGLAYEEIYKVLEPFDIPWVADRDAGAKYRLNSQGDDYYGILRHSNVPTTLVEAMFISNPHEEALLRQGLVQQLIAEALYRALVRYFTTDDPGSGFITPYPRGSSPGGHVSSRCADPL